MESMVDYTWKGSPACYTPITGPLSCIRLPYGQHFILLVPLIHVSYTPYRLCAVGSSYGLSNPTTPVIGNLLWFVDYYNFCYLYKNLAVS